MVIRPTTRSWPVSSRPTAGASRVAGGLPCWLVEPHGLPVVDSGETASRPLLEVPWITWKLLVTASASPDFSSCTALCIL
jgi:hypothetical protein